MSGALGGRPTSPYLTPLLVLSLHVTGVGRVRVCGLRAGPDGGPAAGLVLRADGAGGRRGGRGGGARCVWGWGRGAERRRGLTRALVSAGFPRDCKPEVRWMFAHLDAAGDGLLSREDLYALREYPALSSDLAFGRSTRRSVDRQREEVGSVVSVRRGAGHDERERCLRPFLAACGRSGGGRGGGRSGGRGGLTRAAWCGCLRRAARPCAALARAHPNPGPGAYVPACDARGFYRARQCHAALGVCWCVDAHGVELPASRTKGRTACPEERAVAGEEGEAGPADDEDEAGSGDNELRF
ncbi:Testican-2 [Papilio xuthus]|uniref:Testican-2 n=1 Tax=Papilio xuthus TaxID=66420 RepID=A0A0N1ICR0_PAPXU|nr:Testican-2 [Papilio xuthus]